MKLPFLPRFSTPKTFFQYPLALLLSGLLLCVAPVAAQAQSVTFAGAQTTVASSVEFFPVGVAVDSAGDVFVTDNTSGGFVVKLPRTATGYGPQTTLPTSGLSGVHWSCRGQRRGCVHRRLLQ